MRSAESRGTAAAVYRPRLAIALALTAVYMVVEALGGYLTGSLALIADAGHMLTDVLGLSWALAAIWIAERRPTPERTYGYLRVEVLAALSNGVMLVVLSGYILFQAVLRFASPSEVQSRPMMVVAAVGLGVNVVGVWLLYPGARHSLNVRGAFLEVVVDLLGSVGVIGAGLIIFFTHWYYADPLLSVAIGLALLPAIWNLLWGAVQILLEGTPVDLDLSQVIRVMREVPGVEGVHDLHAWSITSGYVSLTAHVEVASVPPSGETLAALHRVLGERFRVQHATLQMEEPAFRSGHPDCGCGVEPEANRAGAGRLDEQVAGRPSWDPTRLA